jgi:hypothetical protein
MRQGQGGRVPIPTEEDLKSAMLKERVIDACSGAKFGPLIALNIAFRTGDIATVCFDGPGAFHLLRALKSLVPDTSHTGVALVHEGPSGPQVQEGHMSG